MSGVNTARPDEPVPAVNSLDAREPGQLGPQLGASLLEHEVAARLLEPRHVEHLVRHAPGQPADADRLGMLDPADRLQVVDGIIGIERSRHLVSHAA
jgi:hypothetical protein